MTVPMLSEAQLIKTIKALIEKGDKAAAKAEQFHVAAGQHLKTLKAQHTGTWAEWEKKVKEQCGIGKSRASELMRIADGTKTVEQVRDSSNQRKIKHKESSPFRNGESRQSVLYGPARALASVACGMATNEQVFIGPDRAVTSPTEAAPALSPPGLQAAWDGASAEARHEFVAANGAELRGLLAKLRKRATAAAAERVIEQSNLPTPVAPIPDDYPELPTFLNRALAS